MQTEWLEHYLAVRMAELGYREYFLRLRHFALAPGERLEIRPQDELVMITDYPTDIRVRSESGRFDLGPGETGELQREHQGLIQVHNYSGLAIRHLSILQVIPKYQEQWPSPSKNTVPQASTKSSAS